MVGLISTSLHIAAQVDSSVVLSESSVAAGQYYWPDPKRAGLNLDSFQKSSMQVTAFGRLASDWNGYGAQEISQQVRDNAVSFLVQFCASAVIVPDPDISPRPTGTIGFAWETENSEAYLEVGATRYSAFVVSKSGEPFLFEGDAKDVDREFLSAVHENLYAVAAPPVELLSVWSSPDSKWPSSILPPSSY